MRTLYYLFSCMCLVGFATWSYNVNYETRTAAAHLDALKGGISAEEEKIAVLRAEWAYLNRPERLLRLAEANFETLGLAQMRPEHFAEAEQVVFPIDTVDELVRHAVMTSASE